MAGTRRPASAEALDLEAEGFGGDREDLSWLDRLPNYKPISVLNRTYGSDQREPLYIQYTQQFPDRQAGNGAGASTSTGAGRGRKRGQDQEEGDQGGGGYGWITQEGGRKAFVTATQVLTGSKAYKEYEKTKKKKKKKMATARKRRGST